MTVTALRFHRILSPKEVRNVAATMSDAEQVRNLFGYVDFEDAARACVLSLQPRPGTGPYEVLIIAANDTTSDIRTEALVAGFCQDADIRCAFPGVSGVFDVSRAKDVIGWEPRSTWRRSVLS
jgi:UDP-glucose 4-epimerase